MNLRQRFADPEDNPISMAMSLTRRTAVAPSANRVLPKLRKVASQVTSHRRIPIFDGHNDVVLRLYQRGGVDAAAAFLHGEDKGHLDLPKARRGGFAGGLFAIFVPSPGRKIAADGEAPAQGTSQEAPQESSSAASPPAVEVAEAQRVVFAMASLLFRIERESQGRVRLCRNAGDIESCLADDVLAAVLHIEGAEAIDANFALLDVLYAAGLRSLGPVWSRPNAFGHGVPFRCPSSPDTGPGLTDLGKALIGACNRLRILIDLSHLNERGFWDVAAISNAPLVATHSNAHALSAHSRNLTDRQLAAIGEFRRPSRRQLRGELSSSGRPSGQEHAHRTDHPAYRARGRTCRRGQRRLRLRFRRRRDPSGTGQCRPAPNSGAGDAQAWLQQTADREVVLSQLAARSGRNVGTGAEPVKACGQAMSARVPLGRRDSGQIIISDRRQRYRGRPAPAPQSRVRAGQSGLICRIFSCVAPAKGEPLEGQGKGRQCGG